MPNNSAKKWDDMNKTEKIMLIGSALDNFQSIGTAKTGGERLKKIAGLIATAYGMK